MLTMHLAESPGFRPGMKAMNVSRVCVFFFKQKTAYEIYQCDWSSDVCSSDLKRWIRVS